MSDLHLTENQQRAIESHGTNLVVVAGAGAGKTRVLVERYLALLAHASSVTALVAITFTEKAAREMRDRVRAAIETRAANEGGKWAQFLREIDAVRISTIHSLCATILRANAAEARVDPHFAVLDEANVAIWQDEAIDTTLTNLTEQGGDALALLREYDLMTVRETLANLFARGAEVDEAFARLPNTTTELVAQWRTAWEHAQHENLMRWLARADWQAAVNWVCQNAGAAQDRLESLRVQDAQLVAATPTRAEMRTLAAQPKAGSLGRAQAWDDVKLARQMHNTLVTCAREFCEQFDHEITADDVRAAERILQWRSLWAHARAVYTARKDAERALDFNDLEVRTRALLTQPSVRERYRAEVTTVLVDEYQDTNATQRDIIYALAPPDEPNRLFIVGDGKQSIYGFRGAEVSVFTETRHDLAARWGPRAILPLAESFRAHARLVGAFNDLFTRIFAVEGVRADYEIAYEPMVAMRPPAECPTAIEVMVFPGDTTEQQHTTEAQELAARLRALIETQFPVWNPQAKTWRAVQWHDIALLFRASTAMPLYEDVFKQAEIPYRTIAGKGYYDRDWLNPQRNTIDQVDRILRLSVLAELTQIPEMDE